MELCLVCLYLSHWELWRFLLCLRSHFWFGAAMSVLTFGPIWRCHGTRCLRKKRATLKKLFGLPHFPYHPAVDNLCVLLPGTQEVLPEDTLEGGLHQKGYSSIQLSPVHSQLLLVGAFQSQICWELLGCTTGRHCGAYLFPSIFTHGGAQSGDAACRFRLWIRF